MICINKKIMSLKISTTDKLVLSILKELAKDKGIIEASNTEIAKIAKLNRDTCKSSLRRLVKAGLIESESFRTKGLLHRKIYLKDELMDDEQT